MTFSDENIIAKCSFGPGDRHHAWLTPEALLVKLHKQEIQRFERQSVKDILVRHRILWMPLVTGGIITSFATVAMIKTSGAFWLLFLLVLTGIFMLYYGYNGKDSITVSTSVKDYDFFIDYDKPHIKAFIRFVKGQLVNRDPFLYAAADASTYSDWQSSGAVPAGTEVHLRRLDIPPSEIILTIDPQAQDTPLDFRTDEDLLEVKCYLKNATNIDRFSVTKS